MQYDIINFYPSITKNLLVKALTWAKQHHEFSDIDIDIILNARKSFLFNEDSTWIKKNNNDLFDVTMGSFDGAEICELIGLYMLNLMEDILGDDHYGLYRDDGLIAARRTSRQIDVLRKAIIKLYKENELNITTEPNSKIVSYLDVTLDLEKGTYAPFKKPNEEPIYIDIKSNHPPQITKNIPTMIAKRISDLSSNEQIFKDNIQPYQEAINRSGYNSQLTYSKNEPNIIKRRKRGILWYTPPFNLAVKSNIGKEFLNLIDKHFPPNHKYNKILNRNTVKISYSCMRNMSSKINSNNRKKLKQETTRPTENCTCTNCPIEGKCKEKGVIYRATVTAEGLQNKVYHGLSEPIFLNRYNKHIFTFNNPNYKSETRLSKYIWQLKEQGKEYSIKWDIVKKSTIYQTGSRKCDLCASEKVFIIDADPKLSLNLKSELISKCRHQNKHLLSNVKPP